MTATVFFIVLKGLGKVEYVAVVEMRQQAVAHEDMVEAGPAATMLIGAFGTMTASCVTADIMKVVGIEALDGFPIGIVVEIASDDDVSITLLTYGVDSGIETVGHTLTVGAGGTLTVDTAGSMHDEDM